MTQGGKKKNRKSWTRYFERGEKIFLNRSFTGASFYSRAGSLAASAKCQAQPSGLWHMCLFIHLLSTIPHWKDRFISAWENCSRSRLREFCTNRRIMPQAQAHGRKYYTHALTIACGSSEAFSYRMWRVPTVVQQDFPTVDPVWINRAPEFNFHLINAVRLSRRFNHPAMTRDSRKWVLSK